MPDGTRQRGDRRQADAFADWLVDGLTADDEPVDGRPPRHRRRSDDVEPNASERITLIEFLWEGQTGAQQVILVSREWLQ